MSNYITELLSIYQEVKARVNKELAAQGAEVLRVALTNAFTVAPNAKVAAVVGWTPGFNDGEPCIHSGVVYVGKKRHYNGSPYYDFTNDVGSDEVLEYFIADDSSDDNVKCKNDEATPEELDELRAQIELIDDLISQVHGTNYILVAERADDGTINVSYIEYDPGY